MAKRKGAAWWKMFYHQRTTIEMLSDEAIGEALKAAYRYFDGEPVDESNLSKEALIAFSLFRKEITESLEDYAARVADGQEGADRRWHNNK